jgi:hypothetical protein
LATLAAMRRASSLVSNLAAERLTRLFLVINVAQRLPVVVAHHEAGVLFLDYQGPWEAAFCHGVMFTLLWPQAR